MSLLDTGIVVENLDMSDIVFALVPSPQHVLYTTNESGVSMYVSATQLGNVWHFCGYYEASYIMYCYRLFLIHYRYDYMYISGC